MSARDSRKLRPSTGPSGVFPSLDQPLTLPVLVIVLGIVVACYLLAAYKILRFLLDKRKARDG